LIGKGRKSVGRHIEFTPPTPTKLKKKEKTILVVGEGVHGQKKEVAEYSKGNLSVQRRGLFERCCDI